MDDLSVVRALRPMLRRGGVYHLTPELTAVILVSVGPGESWTLLDAAREALSESGVSVRLSAASWPMQGSTVADLVTEAVAALSAEKPAVTQHHDELEFEHLSELLTG